MRLPNTRKPMWVSAVCSHEIVGVYLVTDSTGLSVGR